MRDYGKVVPTFWTRGTGKELRGHPEAQIVALYLMSAPSSNMIGLYYLPVETIAHDTGLPFEGASKGLRRASEGGFCTYHDASEMVFVHTMAPRQLGLEDGEALKPKDNRAKAVLKLMRECGCVDLLSAFYAMYRERLGLPEPWWDVSGKPLGRGFEGASKGSSDDVSTPSKPGSGSGSGSGTGLLASSSEPAGDEADRLDSSPESGKRAKPFEEMCPRAQVIETYFQEYARVRGVRPVCKTREWKSFDTLIEALKGDHARAMTIIRNAFADEFWKGKVTINTIANEPAKFDGQVLQFDRKKPVVQSGGWEMDEAENERKLRELGL